MALVIYDGGQASGSSTINSEGRQVATIPLKNSYSTGFSQSKYKGLSNQGTTCYMNSLLQTLFMTPEFRLEIYGWKYKKEVHGSESYSIPYQLQKIFSFLQNGYSSYMTTKGLTTSFQWDITELISQQDVQEFNRVLFDALEQSTINDPTPLQFSKIYLGEYLSSVTCLECKNTNMRNETFLDISLPIVNSVNKLTYYSLESALEYYIMPGILEGDNLYECNICKKKVKAETKMKFKKIPEILAIQLGRFCIDMKTFTRTKIYDKLTFPYILNMNNFADGYEGIKVHTSPKFSTPEEENEKSNKEKIKENIPIIKEEKDQPYLNTQSNQNSQKEIIQSAKEVSIEPEERIEDIQNLKYFKNQNPFSNSNSNQPASLEIDDQNNYKIKFDNEKFSLGKQVKIKDDEEELEKALEFSKDCMKEEENLNLINQYLKEGPDVFELFSVMMHSGGAYGGHYFAFIKSFEDKTWYNFNDTSVTIIPASEVEKGFGGKNSFSLAYMLFYRRVRSNPVSFKIDNSMIPEYLLKEIERRQKEEEEENLRRKEIENALGLRIYFKNNFEIINVKKDDKLQILIDKALLVFNIKGKIKKENVRIRAYNSMSKLMLSSYDKKEEELISDLNLSSFREYALEIKEDNEEFIEYTNDDCYLKVAVWNPNIISLDEDKINSFPIQVKKNDTMMKCTEIISKNIKIPIENLNIFRKEIKSKTEINLIKLSDPNLKNIQLKDLFIYEGTILYVEDITIQNNPNKWNTVLKDEMEIIFVSFNDPHKQGSEEFDYKMMIRKTNTVKDLKLKIAEMAGINENEFIIKRGSKYGFEFKELDSLLLSYDLFKNTTIYVEFGIPANVGEYRIKLFEARLSTSELEAYQIIEFCIFPIKTSFKGVDLKNLLIDELKAKSQTQISIHNIRLREKAGEKPGKIIKDNDELRMMNLYDNKEFSFQILESLENREEISGNEIIIILRNFDEATGVLSPKKEVLIDPEMSLNLLSYKICNEFPTYRNKIENISVTNIKSTSYVELSNLHTYPWHLTYQLNSKVSDSPLYLLGDFNMVIVRDFYNSKGQEIVKTNIKDMLNKHLADKLSQGPKIIEKSMKIKIKTIQEQQKDEEEKKKKREEKQKQMESQENTEIKMEDLFSEQAVFVGETTSQVSYPDKPEVTKANQLYEFELQPIGGWDNN